MHVESELCTRTRLAESMALWTDEETLKLLELWGEDSIQAELEGCKRNKAVYEKIARDMVAAGYDRNAVQCRDKIKKLRAEYRKIKDNNNQSGRSRKTMKYFDKLDEILGHKPATKPQYVLDTSDESPEALGQSVSYSGDISESDTSPNEQIKEEKEKEEKVKDRDSKDEKTIDLTKVQENRKKRKTAREHTMEKAMDGIISAVTTMQKESNDRFCEIEEKRMRLDEKIMELEHRRWMESQDREERQRREEREFRLQMMHLLSGRPAFSPPFFECCNPSLPDENPGSYEWQGQDKEHHN